MEIQNCTTYVISHYHAKIKVEKRQDSLPLQKTMTFHNVIYNTQYRINQNHYYYNIFLEKCCYQLPKNNDNK